MKSGSEKAPQLLLPCPPKVASSFAAPCIYMGGSRCYFSGAPASTGAILLSCDSAARASSTASASASVSACASTKASSSARAGGRPPPTRHARSRDPPLMLGLWPPMWLFWPTTQVFKLWKDGLMGNL